EDGTLQGVLALAGIPCVGAGVLGSSLAMDKDRTRRVLERAGIPVVRDAVFEGPEAGESARVRRAAETLGWPVFVKPARAGSSVGITKVHGPDGLPAAVAAARAVDPKIVIEQAVPAAREVEVAVLGLWRPEASVVGEIVPGAEFYDYDAKYNDPDSQLLIPAPLAPELADALRGHAVRAFRELDLAGLARVDFLLSRETGAWFLNEVNTLPGFTPISMYPRLWEASGLSYRDLLERLIALAFEAAAAHPLATAAAARGRLTNP
ncbi:MAG: D-alanine--D-alanine ligase, partial [Acidobacteria bacterium]|nr:D-alanine--D-alanine ligase [Acidobacteriota bacterium]